MIEFKTEDLDYSKIWTDIAIKCDETGLSDTAADFELRRLKQHPEMGSNYAATQKMIAMVSGEAHQFVNSILQRAGVVIRMFEEQLDFNLAMDALREQAMMDLEIKVKGGQVTARVSLFVPWGAIGEEYERKIVNVD